MSKIKVFSFCFLLVPLFASCSDSNALGKKDYLSECGLNMPVIIDGFKDCKEYGHDKEMGMSCMSALKSKHSYHPCYRFILLELKKHKLIDENEK